MALTLRIPNIIPLTHAELDGNFLDLLGHHVTFGDASAGTLTRLGANMLVEFTTDITADRTIALPSVPTTGDQVGIVRHAGGFFNITETVTGTILGYRDDYVLFERAASTWAIVALKRAGRVGVRRITSGGTVIGLAEDSNTTQVFTVATTYALTLSLGQSTGFLVRLRQRGAGVVTLQTPLPVGLSHASGPTATTVDGSTLIVESVGSSQVQTSLQIPVPGAGGGGSTDLAPLASSSAVISLAVADFDNSNFIYLTRAGNQFVQIPTGIASGKSIHLAYDETATGEKVLTGAALNTFKAYGLANPQIDGVGAVVTLLSYGSGVVKAIGPLAAATVSDPTILDMSGGAILDMSGSAIQDMGA